MKVLIMTVVLFTSLQQALANDSGMPYIDAEQLTFKGADIGTKITFQGKDALSLFNVLPALSVYRNSRGFTARGQKKAVYIGCDTETYDQKKEDFVKIANGPICTIEVKKTFKPGDMGDDSKWQVEAKNVDQQKNTNATVIKETDRVPGSVPKKTDKK